MLMISFRLNEFSNVLLTGHTILIGYLLLFNAGKKVYFVLAVCKSSILKIDIVGSE